MEVTNIGLFFYGFLFASVDVRAYLNLLPSATYARYLLIRIDHKAGDVTSDWGRS